MEKTQYFFAQVKDINEQDRTVDIIASTSDRDRHSDIVKPEAFEQNLDAFKANPVVLATHQHRLQSGSSPVIGSVIPESIRILKKEVRCTVRFADTQLGEEYWQLYRQGHMKAFSIGFIPIEWTDEKDEELGYIRTYTKIELLEISAVPVPSNRRALVRFKGLYQEDEIKEVVIEILSEQITDLKTCLEDDLEEIKTLLTPDQEGFARELMLGEQRDRSAPAGDKITAELIGKLNQLLSDL